MKLIAEDLGRIRHAQIDLRPFTVFVGENGTNKTWTAHGLFKILERLRTHARQRGLSSESDESLARALDERARAIFEQAKEAKGEARFEVTRADLVGALPADIGFWLAGSQWTSALGFTPSATARLTLRLTREELSAGVASHLRMGLSKEPFRLTTELVVEGLSEPVSATDYGNAAGEPTEAVSKIRAALEDLLLGFRRRVRVLPVEREHLSQIFPWLLARDSGDRLRMPRAHVDFCYLMNEALMNQSSSQYSDALEESELSTALHEVMGGQFRFTGPQRELVFKPAESGSMDIPVKAAASLAKSLVGLEFFLSAAGAGDVLIIDEPEMNAHPQAQVKLVELFALMIRAGMQVVAVTHSPYILDHLSTLIKASRLDETKRSRAAEDLAMKTPHAFVHLDEVEVVHFGRDGEVASLVDRETGAIDWSTFTAVSDRESIAVNRILEEAERGG